MNYMMKNDFLSVEVSTKGAELQSIYSDKLKYEYLWQGDPTFWTGRAPILFPIVGGVINKEYLLEGQKYSIPNHGILRINTFELVSHTDDECVFSFRSTEETLKMYPFDCQVDVKYKLEGSVIIIDHTITNHSQKDMPFGFGLHPAFNLDDTLENTILELEDEPLISNIGTENGFIKNHLVDHGRKILSFNQDSFIGDNTIMFDNLFTRQATLSFKNSDRQVKLTWGDDLPYLAIWAKHRAPYICIEPWSSIADKHTDTINELKDKEGMTVLGPNESTTISYTIELR